MSHPLLPSNQTPLEAALAHVMRPSVDPDVIKTLWDADRCPVRLLPWLAWAMAVDGWELAESEAAQRSLIKNSLAMHRKKGTPWAVRQIIRSLGFGEAVIVEGRLIRRRDGSTTRNGDYVHGAVNAWAQYIVKLGRPITKDQAAMLRSAIGRYAPGRSELVALDYTEAALRHNGLARRDGQFTRGTVTQ